MCSGILGALLCFNSTEVSSSSRLGAFARVDLNVLHLRVLRPSVHLSMHAHADVGGAHAYLGFEPLDLRVLVLQLSPQLIGCDLLRLQDLDQVDVLLHQDLALDHNVRVAGRQNVERVGLRMCACEQTWARKTGKTGRWGAGRCLRRSLPSLKNKRGVRGKGER